jgi:hypothetical protein
MYYSLEMALRGHDINTRLYEVLFMRSKLVRKGTYTCEYWYIHTYTLRDCKVKS